MRLPAGWTEVDDEGRVIGGMQFDSRERDQAPPPSMICPRCGKRVDAKAEGMRAPAAWEGGLELGHVGCLADVQHERGWHARDFDAVPPMSATERDWHPEHG